MLPQVRRPSLAFVQLSKELSSAIRLGSTFLRQNRLAINDKELRSFELTHSALGPIGYEGDLQAADLVGDILLILPTIGAGASWLHCGKF